MITQQLKRENDNIKMITIADCEVKNDNICTYFVLSCMLLFLGCYHFCYHLILSFLTICKCYHFYLIIWCYHLLLSFPPFFLFPENVTHSKRGGEYRRNLWSWRRGKKYFVRYKRISKYLLTKVPQRYL